MAFIALFFATGAVSFIYYRLKDQDNAETLLDVIFLHLPFSLYHAWIFVLLITNLFAIISPIRSGGPSTFQVVFAIAGLAFIASTVIGYIEYKQGDVGMCNWTLFFT